MSGSESVVEVYHCHVCPWHFEGAVCTHKMMPTADRDLWRDIYSGEERQVPPERCPLRRAPTLVKLAERVR